MRIIALRLNLMCLLELGQCFLMLFMHHAGFGHDEALSQFVPYDRLSKGEERHVESQTKKHDVEEIVDLVQFDDQLFLLDERLLVHRGLIDIFVRLVNLEQADELENINRYFDEEHC